MVLLALAIACLQPALGNYWRPTFSDLFQIQFATALNPARQLIANVTMYDLDGFDTPASVVQKLHAKGLKAVCYISAGTYEDWRPDASSFDLSALGAALPEWPGENWLNIKAPSLKPVMINRIRMCAQKGFDAVDFDNVDGYTNNNGVNLTSSDQLLYNTWLAQTAHSYNMSVGLKNDNYQIANLTAYFDFAISEGCWQWQQCDSYGPMLAAGKPVFNIEYSFSDATFTNSVCPQFKKYPGIKGIKKNADLSFWRLPCPDA